MENAVKLSRTHRGSRVVRFRVKQPRTYHLSTKDAYASVNMMTTFCQHRAFVICLCITNLG